MEKLHNPELQLAFDFVQFTNKNIFLTGKAGTGKTTFLRNLQTLSPKRMIVVAPTGVAAINAGGVTIHSFFQMPFGPHIPVAYFGNTNSQTKERFPAGHTRISRDKINIMRSLDLLIIDEISMVRADLLDGIDETLRRYRSKDKPFGGVQLLMIGDVHQLPPVVRDDDWDILRKYYETLYFFGSRALQKTNYISLELKHIYRQSDQNFIEILNKVRENNIDAQTLEDLNKRYIPGFSENNDDGYIILTTHNAQAQEINDSKLSKLKNKPEKFEALITGDFPEYAYPTDKELVLKKGAQVMFVKNDTSAEKLFYNGKIGTISEIEIIDDENVIWVTCPDMDTPIPVKPLAWENVKYTINDETKEIDEDVIGKFIQIPLKLAWAITIHKSQGLTFEKAIIDARASFAHGQVYVALSRCKSLEGMVLNRPISLQSIKNDTVIKEFSHNVGNNPPDEQKLAESRKEYEKALINELFDFNLIQIRIYQSLKLLKEFGPAIFGDGPEKLNNILHLFKTEILEVAGKFGSQLNSLSQLPEQVESNTQLQDRIIKACDYFAGKVKSQIIDALALITIETDNKAYRKEIMDVLDRLYAEASIKLTCLKASQTGFSIKKYLTTQAKASIEKYALKPDKKQPAAAVSGKIPHSQLYITIREWRNSTADELGLPVYMVLPQKTLLELVTELPRTKAKLNKVKGFGKKKTETFGDKILEMINAYCDKQGVEVEAEIEEILSEEPEKKVKENTREVSFNLFQSGKTIDEIASLRGYTANTIEGHLAEYVLNGEIDIHKLIDEDKIILISNYFKKNNDYKLNPAKEALGESVSYGDLKLVLGYLKYKELNNS